jgi:hypothetical protein
MLHPLIWTALQYIDPTLQSGLIPDSFSGRIALAFHYWNSRRELSPQKIRLHMGRRMILM